MTRTFIQTNEFSKRWDELGFDDDSLRLLENTILRDPAAFPVMRGTGGLRKMRFAFPGRSKRRSVRICYVDFPEYQTVYLITAYPKTEKDDLSVGERASIRVVMNMINKALKEVFNE